jgi:hypothetical protein
VSLRIATSVAVMPPPPTDAAAPTSEPASAGNDDGASVAEATAPDSRDSTFLPREPAVPAPAPATAAAADGAWLEVVARLEGCRGTDDDDDAEDAPAAAAAPAPEGEDGAAAGSGAVADGAGRWRATSRATTARRSERNEWNAPAERSRTSNTHRSVSMPAAPPPTAPSGEAVAALEVDSSIDVATELLSTDAAALAADATVAAVAVAT